MTQESDCEKSQTLRRGEKRRGEVEGEEYEERMQLKMIPSHEFATGRKLDTTFGLGTDSTK
jgi:hypothetical protein